MWRRLPAAALLAGALLALSGSTALADGDPASDTLIFGNVSLPYPPPPQQVSAGLVAATRAVYARGNRIKVAVIATANDLGSIPSLFNKPVEYGQFLGQEIGIYYIGPLLIVMPSGFGIYDGGRSVVAEERVLSRLQVDSFTADTLVQSATDAVQKLLAARALTSKDIRPPYAQPVDSVGRRGQAMKLKYAVFDDSGRSRMSLVVQVAGRVVATFAVPLREVKGAATYSVTWLVPRTLPRGAAQLCVTGIDPAGNKSHVACAPIRIA